MSLRDYQQDALDQLRKSIQSRHKAPILVQPCGTGKTHVATEIIKAANEKGRRTIFLAPRRELIYQTSDNLWENHKQEHGVIMAGEPRTYSVHQIASFDTLHSRSKRRSGDIVLPGADLVIVDEAHLSIAPTRKRIIDEYLRQGAIVIGMTATPARGDGKGLGAIYDDLIVNRPVKWFVDNGYLVPATYYAPSRPDLDKVKVRAGDYVEKELGGVMDQPKLIGDIVEQWHRLAAGRSTVVYCVNRAHSRHLTEAFVASGVRAEHLDGETPNNERREILRRVANGQTTVLCNVFVATYGLDIPSLEVAVLARPTKNLTLYQQTLGRVMRTSPGKTDALVIDHSGAIEENGFFDDPVEWSLDSKRTVKERREQAQKERKEPKDITCAKCQFVFRARRDCPRCGHQMIAPTEEIPVHHADLEQVKSKTNREMSWEEKEAFMAGLKHHCKAKGYKPGWAANAYRAKTGVWPNDPRVKNVPPRPPNEMTKGFIKYLQIRAARSRHAG